MEDLTMEHVEGLITSIIGRDIERDAINSYEIYHPDYSLPFINRNMIEGDYSSVFVDEEVIYGVKKDIQCQWYSVTFDDDYVDNGNIVIGYIGETPLFLLIGNLIFDALQEGKPKII